MNFFLKILFCLCVLTLIFSKQNYAVNLCNDKQLPQKINTAVYQEALKEANLRYPGEKHKFRASSKYKKIVLYVLGTATLFCCAAGIYVYLKNSKQVDNSNPPTHLDNSNFNIVIQNDPPLHLNRDEQNILQETFRQAMRDHGNTDLAIQTVCNLHPDRRFRFIFDIVDAHGFHTELDAVFPP